jgi:hypothetical protein
LDKVFVTLLYGQNQQIDVALPADIPSQFIAGALAKAVGMRLLPGQVCALEWVVDGQPKKIAAARSPADARILNGGLVQICLETPTISQAGYLVSERNLRFIINKPEIVVGRPAGRASPPVDVDLSPLDDAKVVSRRHALIRAEHHRMLIADFESANGTWVNGTRLQLGQWYVLRPGDRITFGNLEHGVMLEYRKN